LVNFNWASRAEKRVLVYKMARKWRERVAEEFETRRERAAIDVDPRAAASANAPGAPR